MRRHELSDQEWDHIKDILPAPKDRGRPPSDTRMVLNGMLWTMRTGAPWRDVPEWLGPRETVYDRFNRWSKDGTLDRVVELLQALMQSQGKIDWKLFCIDGSVIRASRAAAGARKKTAAANP